MSAWTQTYCCKEEVDDFLGPRGATYAHQLNVLSRIADRVLGIKPLPAGIHALLDLLRKYRNDLGHRGVLDNPKRPPLDKAKAAEFLAAAVFGYHYAQYMRRNVAQGRSTTDRATDK